MVVEPQTSFSTSVVVLGSWPLSKGVAVAVPRAAIYPSQQFGCMKRCCRSVGERYGIAQVARRHQLAHGETTQVIRGVANVESTATGMDPA